MPVTALDTDLISSPDASPAKPSFSSALGMHDLLDAVRDIALSATRSDPDRARLLSKRRWDRQRSFLRRFDLPTAETIRQRLHATWERTLDTALSDNADRVRILNRLQPRSPSDAAAVAIDDIRALLCVAHRLGSAPSEVEYERVRRDIDRERARRQYALPALLPSSAAIKQRHENSWGRALDLAGIARPRQAPRTLETAVVLLDVFFDHHDFIPSQLYFRRWVAMCGEPLPRTFYRRSFMVVLNATRRRRRARGASMPKVKRTAAACPPLPSVPQRTPYTHDDRLAALRHYAATYLMRGQRPLAKHYQAVSVGDPRLMAFGILTHDGKNRWQDLCREAGITP